MEKCEVYHCVVCVSWLTSLTNELRRRKLSYKWRNVYCSYSLNKIDVRIIASRKSRRSRAFAVISIVVTFPWKLVVVSRGVNNLGSTDRGGCNKYNIDGAGLVKSLSRPGGEAGSAPHLCLGHYSPTAYIPLVYFLFFCMWKSQFIVIKMKEIRIPLIPFPQTFLIIDSSIMWINVKTFELNSK